MSDRKINTVEEMKDMLANHIADDSKRLNGARKFKFSNWRNGLTRLIELSEHGYELIDFEITTAEVKDKLIDNWRKNRFGEPVGRKTAAQIAKVLGYDLTVEIAQAIVKDEKNKRNKARNSIAYYQREINVAVVEGNAYFSRGYAGVLEGLPRGAHFKVTVELVDADGNVCTPELVEE